MKKSLSLLLAIALVFGMFQAMASAATPTASEAGKQLVDLGILKGDKNGNLLEDSTWNRQDIVVLLSRLLGKEEAAQSTAKSHTYKDVPKGYYDGFLSWAKNEKYAEGYSATKFGFGETLTYKQFAAIVLRALGKDTTGTNYENTAAWAVELKLLPEGTNFDAPAKRGDTFVSIVAALNTEVAGTGKKLGEILGLPGFKPVAPAISAKAVGAKKVEVSFNKPVDDTKVAFTVKKSTITLNVSAKSFSEDKKTATLELSSKLTTGDYTVSATGVEDAALTSAFKAEDEKVTKIEFLATNAPLTDLDGDGIDDLSIPYKVSNQYGENVTKFTTLNSNYGPASINSTNGTIDISSGAGSYKINDVVTVTLVHAQTATSVVQTFTVAAQARVADVAITGIYNKDGKTINEDTNLNTDKFYLLLEAKDQYGNPVSNVNKLKADLIINETNPAVVRVDPAAAPAPFETVSVKGNDTAGVRLVNPNGQGDADIGTTTITLISNTTGHSANSTVTVSEAARADVVNLVNPGLTVADEDAYFPAEVFDKNGNAITDLNVLNNATKGVKITFNGVTVNNPFVKQEGVVNVKIPKLNNNATGIKTIIAMSSSNKISSLMIDVKDAAVPTVVRGFDSDFNKAKLDSVTASFTVDVTNLAIEDQYGRVMSDADVKTWLDLTANNRIEFTEASTAAASAISIGGTKVINASGDSFTVTVNPGKASEKLTITLGKDAGVLMTASAVDQTIRVTDGTEFTSYSVDTIGTVYDETANSKANVAAYNKQIKVYGHLDDGNKVQLPTSYYKVNALANTTVNNDVYDSLIGDVALNLSYGDKSEIVVPVTVTINAKGQQLTQDVTFSKASPKVAEVKFVKTSDGVNGGAKSEISINAANYNVSDLINGTYSVVVTDQYGQKKLVNANGSVLFDDGTAVTAVTFTVTPVNGNITITNNGTANAAVSGLAAYQDFDVTVTYAGGVSATIKVRY